MFSGATTGYSLEVTLRDKTPSQWTAHGGAEQGLSGEDLYRLRLYLFCTNRGISYEEITKVETKKQKLGENIFFILRGKVILRGSCLNPGTANLRSTVREASARSIFRPHFFFRFQKLFCRFLRKKNSDIFLRQIIFQVKIWWVEKISRNNLVR